MTRVLITGANGLIGSALARRLTPNYEIVGFDVAGGTTPESMDVTIGTSIDAAIEGCSGVVHLAAVSRVVWGEQDPTRCQRVNVGGTANVLAAAAKRGRRTPWVVLASSREVYGQATVFPVPESAPLRPLNTYARSKARAEALIHNAANEYGIKTSIVRFSSVYGSINDHQDRVVPAFVRRAIVGEELTVEGANTMLDFTHIDDVASGVSTIVDLMSEEKRSIPVLHLVSGQGTTLEALANIAVARTGRGVISFGVARNYDVKRFVGDPTRAEEILGWRARVPLEEGVGRMIDDFGKVITVK